MDDKWISMAAYMRMYNLGYETVKNMIYNGDIEAKKTQGGQYRIRVGKDIVSKEVYEAEKERRIKAEAKIEMLKSLILQESN